METTHRVCSKCKECKELSEFYKDKRNVLGYTYQCKSCYKTHAATKKEHKALYDRAYRSMNKEKITSYKKTYYQNHSEYRESDQCKYRAKIDKLMQRYGVDEKSYTVLVEESGNTCYSCGKFLSGDTKILTACLDHDHKTGEVRGILCRSCNMALGLLGDSLNDIVNLYIYREGY